MTLGGKDKGIIHFEIVAKTPFFGIESLPQTLTV